MEYLRQLVFIVLMAGLFFLLLPSEGVGKYARLVMALFVLATLLTPLSRLRQDGQALQMQQAVLGIAQKVAPHLAALDETNDRSMAAAARQQVLEQTAESMRARVEAQTEALGWQIASFQVHWQGNEPNPDAGFFQMPEVASVEVTLRGNTASDAIPAVAPVEIGKPGGAAHSTTKQALPGNDQVTETIAHTLGLPTQAVHVHRMEGDNPDAIAP
ncbi:MAG: stage III sporulation protein AF [Firmicutes bacterium]|nr:stage III sporulation protein AF [Bacillota bacterium]